jgi:hypothetical protein
MTMTKTAIQPPTALLRLVVCLCLTSVAAFSPWTYQCVAFAGSAMGVALLENPNQNANDDVIADPIFQIPPPPPPFVPKQLPVILGAGLFLFASSVKGADRAFATELLQQAQAVLRQDPTIIMELGQAVETGGVYSSLSTTCTANVEGNAQQEYKQLVLQFQIEGGNAWAQGVAYGIQECNSNSNAKNKNDEIQLVSLEVANMDATINGTPFEITIPWRSQ